MSETDSFIQEVSEEVRRDRLFGYIKRYGWIGVLVVVLIVGGAAYNEWRKASARAAAEARGDAILAALEADDPAGRRTQLAGLEIDGDARAIVSFLTATTAIEDGDPVAAAEALTAIESDTGFPQLYRDLATLKRLSLAAGDTPPSDRIAALQPLLIPGGPYRVLAEEQVALAEIEMGERDAARQRLERLVEDTEATAGLRRRASQLIIVLGGAPDPA